MEAHSPDLIALIGSRICHDLISPLGAIGNGVELLAMAGTAPGPELALIAESVSNANARIRFFRIAFGAVGPGQAVARSEIRSILDDMSRGGRLRTEWDAAGDTSRHEVKLAFLAFLCLETAMPFGGRIRITGEAGRWLIAAEASRLKLDTPLWDRLGGDAAAEVTAAQVQFALLPAELARQGRRIALHLGEQDISMRF